MLLVSTDQLLKLTVDDLGDERIVEFRDPENQTEQHLLHLKKLVEERYQRDVAQYQANNSASKQSTRDCTPVSSSYSATPVMDEEEEKQRLWRREEEAYQALVADGGRPSHPIELGRPHISEHPESYKEYTSIITHWRAFGDCCNYTDQLEEWQKFRIYQDKVRSRDKWFQNHLDLIQEICNERQQPSNIQVLRHRAHQTRLEDWNEFRAFQYLRFKESIADVEQAERELLETQSNVKELAARLAKGTQRKDDGPGSRFASEEKTFGSSVPSAHKRSHSSPAFKNGSTESNDMKEAVSYVQQIIKSQKWGLEVRRQNVARFTALLDWIDGQYPYFSAESRQDTTGSRLGGKPLQRAQMASLTALLDWIDGRWPYLSAELRQDTTGSRLGGEPLQRAQNTRSLSCASPNNPSRIKKTSSAKASRHQRGQSSTVDHLPHLLRRSQRLLNKQQEDRRLPRAASQVRARQSTKHRLVETAQNNRPGTERMFGEAQSLRRSKRIQQLIDSNRAVRYC